MPPVMMIGVITSASSPTSTLRRVTSKAFEAERKFSPVRLKTAHSTKMTTSRTHSLFGKRRSRHGASVLIELGVYVTDSAIAFCLAV